jgi:hypothetical protein
MKMKPRLRLIVTGSSIGIRSHQAQEVMELCRDHEELGFTPVWLNATEQHTRKVLRILTEDHHLNVLLFGVKAFNKTEPYWKVIDVDDIKMPCYLQNIVYSSAVDMTFDIGEYYQLNGEILPRLVQKLKWLKGPDHVKTITIHRPKRKVRKRKRRRKRRHEDC